MTAIPAHSQSARPEKGDLSPPKHVAIIMDGNGRWAKARGLSRTEGHKEGVQAARRCVEAARDLGLTHLTLYSFSTENWRRPAGEIRDLMGLLREFIVGDLPRLKKENCRVRIIGDRENLSLDLRALVNKAEKETRDNTAFLLQIAFNYGGRDEIRRAAKSLVEDVKSGSLQPKDIDEKTIAGYLDTDGVPDPDIVIRTSGEKRVSNFLLWQAAYAEYIFLDVLWPDFSKKEFAEAIEEYYNRERRYGGVGTS
ncbi:isoprenyl transferase [Hyphococcus formosus]|uniref:isoprenyl transferase n=1 Tax=Hyphococcus formosus TaxID=3143534 RepID=UPI00398ACEEA